MIAPNTFVRMRDRRPPEFPHYDLGVVSTIDGRCAQVSFPGRYPEPWPIELLEKAENPIGIIPITLLGPGGFYDRMAYWQKIWDEGEGLTMTDAEKRRNRMEVKI